MKKVGSLFPVMLTLTLILTTSSISAQGPRETSWYLDLRALEGLELSRESIVLVNFPLEATTDAQVDSEFFIGGGWLLQFLPRFTLDLGVGVGLGTVDQELTFQNDLRINARSDVDLFRLQSFVRFSPMKNASSNLTIADPWISAGLRRTILRPTDHGEALFGDETLPLDFGTQTDTEFAFRAGASFRIRNGLELELSGEYGFEEENWSLGLGIRVAAFPSRRDFGDPINIDNFNKTDATGCEFLDFPSSPAQWDATLEFSGRAFGNAGASGCELRGTFDSNRNGILASITQTLNPNAAGNVFSTTATRLDIGEHRICLTVDYVPSSTCNFSGSCQECDVLEIDCPEVPAGTFCGKDHAWWQERVCEGSANLVLGSSNSASTVLEGTDRRDLIIGTDARDSIFGLGGNDCIYGMAGNDRIRGGSGEDTIFGGEGPDDIRGGDDDDAIHGEGGNDEIHGDGTSVRDSELFDINSGDDTIHGGPGDDEIFGDPGNDTIHGGDGDDHIEGDAGDDTVFAGSGRDFVKGGAGDDRIHGGPGNDELVGDSGRDELHGEDGDDTLKGDSGRDDLHGGAGNDKMKGDSGRDRCFGGGGRDFCKGDSSKDTLQGGDGEDRLCGNSGSDSMDGGGGKDACRSPKGNCEKRAKQNQCTTAAWNRWLP